jgi:hypothetical protein
MNEVIAKIECRLKHLHQRLRKIPDGSYHLNDHVLLNSINEEIMTLQIVLKALYWKEEFNE